jgi:uncharacterized surface protein with fasciclin (FAS1) repeats
MKIKTAVTGGVAALLILTGCSSSTETPAASTTSAAATSAEASEPETSESEAMESEAMESGTGESGASESGAAAAGTIVDVAAGNPDFSTRVAAVEAAGLVETLSGEGPFTVFAPTNEAFAALPEGVLDMLLLPENQETLVQVLTYHVVPGEVTSDLVTAGDVATVEGSTIAITTDDGVKINGTTTVTAVDVEASNGVIHVIDAVLIPAEVAATL